MPSHNNGKKKFKILALDGGGIRGIITAQILETVEAKIKKRLGKDIRLNQYFDLIAGTSTGSILAAGLAIGKTPTQLKEIYSKSGGKIFNTSWLRKNTTKWIYGSKYPNEGLIEVLQNNFGDITLREVYQKHSAELLILAYDTFHRNTTFFISPCPEQNRWFNDMKLWEICTSSSSAPTFFPPYEFKFMDTDDQGNKVERRFPHVDGGLSANCPAMAALSHVMKIKRKKIEDISILSIGTGRTTKPLEHKEMKNWGTLLWGTHVSDVFMGSQIQITTDACEQMVNSANPNGYLRLQFELNQRFGQNGELLPSKEQKNKYINDKISEEMDDASINNIDKLLAATKGYIKDRDQQIEDFIEAQEAIEELQPVTI